MLVERYGSRVHAVLEKQLGDHHHAMDMAQDVWIRVFRGLHSFRSAEEGGRFRPWLFAIAFNLVRDQKRRPEWGQEVALEEHLQHKPAAERYNPSGRVEELAAIDEALNTVPDPFRAALHLVDVVGLSYQEAGDSLGCSLGTVKSRVNRGRLAFRDIFLKLSGHAPRVSLEMRNRGS